MVDQAGKMTRQQEYGYQSALVFI